MMINLLNTPTGNIGAITGSSIYNNSAIRLFMVGLPNFVSVTDDNIIMAQGDLLPRCQSHYILVSGVLNDFSAVMVSPTFKQSAEAPDYAVLKIVHVAVMFIRGSESEPRA